MWELDYKENWAPKNWCFWTTVLEKTRESLLDCKEIQPVHPKGNQSWIFIGRADAEAETPILWPPDVKSQLIWKDPDAGTDWGQEEKGTTEDEMAGWHHRLDGHELSELREMVMDREAWRAAKSRTQLSNWTELSTVILVPIFPMRIIVAISCPCLPSSSNHTASDQQTQTHVVTLTVYSFSRLFSTLHQELIFLGFLNFFLLRRWLSILFCLNTDFTYFH